MSIDIHPTKFAILQAAVNVFSQKGFNGTTTKEISQAAGIAEGTIFRHFSTKTDILYGVVDSFIPILGVETLQKAITECRDMDASAALQHIIHNRFETITAAKDLIRIILTEIQYDSNLRDMYFARVYKPIRQMLIDFFTEGIKKGDFREMNPDLPTNIIISFILFAIGKESFLGSGSEHDVLPEDLTDLLINGIKKE